MNELTVRVLRRVDPGCAGRRNHYRSCAQPHSRRHGAARDILGIAGLFLLLSAELLAAVQVIVYAGAVVVLFLFVIMLLGPSAVVAKDSTTQVPRFVGAGLLVGCGVAAVGLLANVGSRASSTGVVKSSLASGQAAALFPVSSPSLGTIEGVGRELFTTFLVPFELSAALLLVAIVGAVAVARGRQPDPTVARSQDAVRQSPPREESHP